VGSGTDIKVQIGPGKAKLFDNLPGKLVIVMLPGMKDPLPYTGGICFIEPRLSDL